jgi:pimeloyl-ACP methyl ester carboxylesterase
MTSTINKPKNGDPVIGLSGFTHNYAAVNGTTLHYAIGGEGPAIVLLHGWPYNWSEWIRLMPLLAQNGRRVIVPDLRGFGFSDIPEDGYSKANVARDIHELLKLLGVDEIDLVAVDIGTMVAYSYASIYPDTVRHLVVGEAHVPALGLEEAMNFAVTGYWHFAFQSQVDMAAMLTDGKEEAYLMPIWKLMSSAPDAENVARELYLPHFVQPKAMWASFKHYESLVEDGRYNREHFTEKLPMPVLVLDGANGIPHHEVVEAFKKAAMNVEDDVVPEAGHSHSADNPEWVAARLEKFLS